MLQHLAQHQYRTMFYQNLANLKTMELTISPFGKFWLKQPKHDKPGVITFSCQPGPLHPLKKKTTEHIQQKTQQQQQRMTNYHGSSK